MNRMPEVTGTSFIPKNTSKIRKPRVGKRIYLFSYVSYVIFFGTLLMVIATYLFSLTVKSSLEEQRGLLAEERATFSEGEIARVRDLEKRLLVANRLVAESSAPSRLFESLEQVVAASVQLVSFSYERLPGNSFMLTFIGATDSFDSALFQRELFAAVPALANSKVATYTYGTPTDGEQPEIDVGGRRLVVTFENTASTALIPYEPAAVSVFDVQTETEVVPEVGTTTQSTASDAAGTEVTSTSTPVTNE